MSKKKGILLMAFGSPEYIYMAAQMAMSIRVHNKKIPIQLVHDWHIGYLPEQYHSLFSQFTSIEKSHFFIGNNFEPGFAKIKAYNYSVFEETIFLDVDGICLKDIEPLFDHCKKYYHTEVIGSGKIEEKIEYAHWANNKETWEVFGLSPDQTYFAVQSSFQYFRKCKEMDALAKSFKKEFNFPKENLTNEWGKSIPDELIIGGACAKANHDPSIDTSVTFFGNKGNRKEIAQVMSDHYISSLYGNGRGTKLVMERYVDMYDRLMFKYAREMKMTVIRRASQLMKNKHVG